MRKLPDIHDLAAMMRDLSKTTDGIPDFAKQALVGAGVSKQDVEDADAAGRMSDADFLRDLADRLMTVPVTYGTDQGDIDRLRRIADSLKWLNSTIPLWYLDTNVSAVMSGLITIR